jgi:hypothetical protein
MITPEELRKWRDQDNAKADNCKGLDGMCGFYRGRASAFAIVADILDREKDAWDNERIQSCL